ncbi:MAG: IS200/IS605 family element transposase accessory protein TnpB [Candidatus Parcubacteria bacterium]|nr:IS200/IS605 family element transposase accessory protein TnpB [Leptolyngbyaceae cyanobacterium LF-bin-113]
MGKPKKQLGVQQNLISPNPELKAVLEYVCAESNKLHNCAVYYARQIYFKTKRYVTPFDLNKELGSHPHFAAMCAQAAQQTCGAVGESVKSFSELIKLFWQGELKDKPKFPNYRKPGMHLVAYPKQALKLVKGQIRFPLGLKVKAWFGVSEFFLPMPSNLDFAALREVRILPRNGEFYAEFVYPVVSVKTDLDKAKVLGVDPGLNNWVACVSNAGTSFSIDGRKLKSMNQWYNKSVAKLMDSKDNGYWSKRLARLTEKRNRVMRDAVNKSAKKIVDHCIQNGIGTIAWGWNDGQKDSANMGSKTNQKYVQIPHARLKGRVKQLCEKYGIQFVQTEESYTSQASFVDRDELPVYGEKPEGWKPSGRRVKRGLYRAGNEWRINADCNGAANIIRKVAVIFGFKLEGISRGVLTAPLKLQIWS